MIVNIDNIDINYICEGQGKDVLILHGWGANIQAVLPIHNYLKDRFRVFTLDLPGFGKSHKPHKAWGTNNYADIIKKFIDRMKMKDIILIGHSHGGRVSIVLGSKYCDIFNKIILVDSAGIIPKRSMQYYLKVYTFKTLKNIYNLLFFWTDKQKRMEKFYRKFGSSDYKNANGVMRKTLVKVVNEDFTHLLNKIKVPTLLIWGRDDEDTPVYMGEIMEKKIEDSGLVVLDNAGHYSYIDQYNSFKRIIDKFLENDYHKGI